MPIATQDIINRVRQALDAEEAPTSPQLGYYDDAKDLIPAIGNALQWFVSIINSFLEEKKFSSELFRELMYNRIFLTSGFSRIFFDPAQLGHDVWSILAVYPKPTTYPVVAPPHVTNPYTSLLMANLSFVSGTDSAKRLTLGEWNRNAKNPFEDGNIIFTPANAPGLVSYAYLNHLDYRSSNYQPGVPQEIEIRPSINNAFCSVVYVKNPDMPTSNNSVIELPVSASNILFEKTLSFIAAKIGDHTTIKTTSDEQLTQLLKAII